MTLPATPESVRTARRFVAERVRGCSTNVASTAVLLTSELATNCVMHARTGFVVRVRVDDDAVRVELADDEPGTAAPGGAGSGLRLVSQLAERWGSEPTDAGKVVWFEVS